jgi:hypothetical protein
VIPKDLIHEHPQPVMLLIADGRDDDAGRLEQVSGDHQSPFEEGKPLAGLRPVVRVYVPVVVDPALVAGVVGRIDVDQIDLAPVCGPKRLKGVEVFTVDNGMPGRASRSAGDAVRPSGARERRAHLIRGPR